MRTNLFLIFMILAILSQSACNYKPKDDYEERVAGVISYLGKEHRLATKDCMTLLLLQSSKCNICTLDNLKEIYEDSRAAERLVVVLSGPNESLYDLLNKEFSNKQILVDTNQVLGKYGLSFMRNLKADICSEEVESYKFY